MKKNNPKNIETATGVIKVHPRGFGFLLPEERELYPEDIFIPRHATKGAVDGDLVEATVQPSPKGPEGRVCKILRRGRQHVAGTIAMKLKKGAYAYVPLLGEDRLMRIVPSEEREFQTGDRVIIKVLDWGSDKKESLGQMSAYLGHISDPSCDIKAAIEEFELDDAFSKKVLKEACSFGPVNVEEHQDRENLCDLECVTIDPDSAKDYDDALSISKDKKENYLLGVHIADVSYYVRPQSHLDKEARERCNSVYFPGCVLPMLPHELSSDLCSLKPNVVRLAVSIFMTFDVSGELIDYKICRSLIKSKKRFTYKLAKEVLDGKKKSTHAKSLHLMVELCAKLKKKRYERGSIEFSLPDTYVHVDENGAALKVELIEYDVTHQLVEEFMLKANEVVATHLTKKGKPLAYRIHDEPNAENLKEFASLGRALGFKLSENPTTEELQSLFDEARNTAFGQFLATSFIRNMKLANYSTQNIGHYGLGLEAYTHFTSPIRRYIDLIVHRVLLGEINSDEDLEAVALQCSEKERLSARAENVVVALKKLRLLQEIQKKDPHKHFEAVITSVKPFGFAFELVEFLYDGFLPVSEIEKNGKLFFDENKRKLKINSVSFHSGDRIEVSLKSVNLITQVAEWSLAFPVIASKRKAGRKK